MSSVDRMLWVFGYGSLIWKPPEGFEHVKAIPGGIKGWHRRLWQGSTDHRGLPGAPGLVATLLQTHDLPEAERPPADELCWGMCYGYDESQRDQVLAYLDFREKDGYDRTKVDVYLPGGKGVREGPDITEVLLYVATTSNPQYLGPLSNQKVAEQVACAVGPSGTNHQYVTNLARGLQALNVGDEHVFDVVARLEGMELAAEDAVAHAFVGDGQYKGDGGWMLQKLWELSDMNWSEVEGCRGVYQRGGSEEERRRARERGEEERGKERGELLTRIAWPPSMSSSSSSLRLPAALSGEEEAGVEVHGFPDGGALIHSRKGGTLLCTASALPSLLVPPS